MADKSSPTTPLPSKGAADSQDDATNNNVYRPKTPSTDQSPKHRMSLPSGSPSVEPPPRKKRNYPQGQATASKSRPRTIRAASSNLTPPIVLAPIAASAASVAPRPSAFGLVPAEPQVTSVINTPTIVQNLHPVRPNNQPRFIPSATILSTERIASLQSFQSMPTDFPRIHPLFSLEYLMWTREARFRRQYEDALAEAPAVFQVVKERVE